MRKLPSHIHVVWAPNSGPLVGYANPELAHAHARTMVGVDVHSIELRDQLPNSVREDIASDYYDDDFTPVDSRIAIARFMRIEPPTHRDYHEDDSIAYEETDQVSRIELDDVDDDAD